MSNKKKIIMEENLTDTACAYSGAIRRQYDLILQVNLTDIEDEM